MLGPDVDSSVVNGWEPQPAASRWLDSRLESLVSANPRLAVLSERMRYETGNRLWDWIDHLALPASPELAQQLNDLDFCRTEVASFATPWTPATDPTDGAVFWKHRYGSFPRILELPPSERPIVAVRIESLDDFLAAHGLCASVRGLGEPDGLLRTASICRTDDCDFWVVERHGWQGFVPPRVGAEPLAGAVHYRREFKRRLRDFPTDAEGFETTRALIEKAVGEIGPDWACDLFFQAERKYWQSRNYAARWQKARQNRLGLGWGNHDHHTYRSSRQHFHRLIQCLELLGLQRRDCFYAGQAAGWGALVLEQPQCGVVVFADVDLRPEEVGSDIAHRPLLPLKDLGTIGMWCRLHGEAFLRAGMHHLECRFDFAAAREQLSAAGIDTMAPFSELPHLKQAFTVGERWSVPGARLDRLVALGSLSQDQAERFRREGAVGSHLEILERNDGYRGFNPTGIGEILARTDPRQLA